MHKQLLAHWRPADLLEVDPVVLRVAGQYLHAASGFYLLFHPNCTFVLGCYRDLGGHWDRVLTGAYQVEGPVVRLRPSATQQQNGFYARYATLLLHYGPGGRAQWLLPLTEADPPLASQLLRQPVPQLVRCISAAFGSKSFATSLTVGRLYTWLGPASKAEFVLVLNDNNRVRQYPAGIFRSPE